MISPLRRHDVPNNPKNVQRFPDCNCSEDCLHDHGTGKKLVGSALITTPPLTGVTEP
jgi:hypothetical protein